MSGINVTISSTSPGVSIGGGTAVSVAVSGQSSPVSVSLLAGGSTTLPDITQLEAGPGITISTAANQFTISGYSTAQLASYSPVKSVNGKIGTVTLQAVDVTAASVSHTHTTTEVVGITALLGATSPVQSVAGRTGVITLSTVDVAGLAAIATSGSASDLASGSVPAARLPVATSTALGAIQVGSGLSITSGVLSATGGGGGGATFSTVPSSATATGTSGTFASDSSWLYACYATDQWLRVARDAWLTVPGAPTITSVNGTFTGPVVSGNSTGGVVTVYWTAPQNTGGAITGYLVQLDSQSPVSVGASATNYTFTGITASQYACYGFAVSVRAVNGAGQSSAATASGVIGESAYPAMLGISKVPNEMGPGVQYSVSWRPPCPLGAWTHYEVQIREYYNGSEVVVTGSEDGWSTWATVSGTNGNTAWVSSATSNQQYQFRVRALTISNGATTATSGWSNVQTL